MAEGGSFDAYVERYDSIVESAIGASGERLSYFADLKADLAARAAARAGVVPRDILDFGCGTGNSTRALARSFPDARIVGVDESLESIRWATTHYAQDARIRFEPSVGMALPFSTGSFDVVFAACVFHHVPAAQHGHWLSEHFRVLRPGGRAYVFEHNPLNPLTVRVVRSIPFDEGVQLLSGARLRALLGDQGFNAAPPYFYFFFPRALRALRGLEPLLRRVPFGAQYYVEGERPR